LTIILTVRAIANDGFKALFGRNLNVFETDLRGSGKTGCDIPEMAHGLAPDGFAKDLNHSAYWRYAIGNKTLAQHWSSPLTSRQPCQKAEIQKRHINDMTSAYAIG
jgi:hypothetical protein